jgi:hypothetical protein
MKELSEKWQTLGLAVTILAGSAISTSPIWLSFGKYKEKPEGTAVQPAPVTHAVVEKTPQKFEPAYSSNDEVVKVECLDRKGKIRFSGTTMASVFMNEKGKLSVSFNKDRFLPKNNRDNLAIISKLQDQNSNNKCHINVMYTNEFVVGEKLRVPAY